MHRLMLAPLLFLACKESIGPIRPDQAALASALATAGLLAGRASGYNALAFSQIDKKGTLTLTTASGGTAAYDAVGVVVSYDLGDQGGAAPEQGWFNGVVAWTGLDETAGTTEQVSSAGAEGSGIVVMLTGTVQVDQYANNRGGIAQFYSKSGNAFYAGTTGSYAVDRADFGNLKACATAAEAPVLPVTCRVATGTMQGSFNYGAQLVSGTGAATYTQAQVSFSLPAIRVTLSN